MLNRNLTHKDLHSYFMCRDGKAVKVIRTEDMDEGYVIAAVLETGDQYLVNLDGKAVDRAAGHRDLIGDFESLQYISWVE